MIPIKTYEPRWLYRYRSLGDDWKREIDCICNSQIWFSTFKHLNDPMEGSYAANARVRKLTKYQTLKQQIYDGKLAVGICSLSETNNNGPMWAHYADEFRGICIEYDLKKLLACKNGDDISLARVTYSENRYQLSLSTSKHADVVRQILSFKSHRWLDEREWRLFKSADGILQLSQNCVSRVFAGNRMKQSDIQKIKAAFVASDIPISVMKLKGYTIKFERKDTA